MGGNRKAGMIESQLANSERPFFRPLNQARGLLRALDMAEQQL